MLFLSISIFDSGDALIPLEIEGAMLIFELPYTSLIASIGFECSLEIDAILDL